MKSSVDLHMHSTCSDGTLKPAELMKLCAKKKLKTVALTDHDTFSGYLEAKVEADELGIRLISGVEMSVYFEPGALHILGYFMDVQNEKMIACLEDIQASRRERNPKIIEKLNDLGLCITLEEVEAEAGELGQVGRPHFAAVLLKKGYVRTSEEAFKKYLAKGSSAHVEKWRLSCKEAIGLINDAGGVASVAHPASLRLDYFDLEEEIKKMANDGLGAIEAYHSSHKPRQRSEYAGIAKKFGLALTGGSDFHGKNKPRVKLAELGPGVYLTDDDVEKLSERRGGSRTTLTEEGEQCF